VTVAYNCCSRYVELREKAFSLKQKFMDWADDVSSKRRRNAQILINGLKTIEEIKAFADFKDAI